MHLKLLNVCTVMPLSTSDVLVLVHRCLNVQRIKSLVCTQMCMHETQTHMELVRHSIQKQEFRANEDC